METKKKKIKFVGTLLVAGIFALILCSFASAIGFSTIYSETNPVTAAPGETVEIQVHTGIAPTDSEMKVQVSLTEGGEIAALTDGDGTYDLKPGSLVPVSIRITIPSSAAEGTRYNIGLVVRSVTPSEGGMVSISGETGTSFPVIVKIPTAETPAPETGSSALWWAITIVVVLAIVVILYLLLKKKK